jgi:two-component system phosphate regulon sensor histidine kinase PhoR
MAPERVLARRTVFLALLPTLVLVAGLAILDEMSPAAVVIVALTLIGVVWLLPPRLDKRPAEAPLSEPTPAAVTAEDILDYLPEPVLLLNPAREIVAASRAAQEALGVSATGRDLALSLRHPAVLAAVDRATDGQTAVAEDVTLPVPVPCTYSLHVTRLAEAGSGGRPLTLLHFRDETRARRAEQSRTDFVANATHELRSPLAALIGFIETLRGPARDDSEARDRFLAIMSGEARRMARLIEDLLSLSRVEINEHIPPREAVDITLPLRRTIETLSARAHDKGMTIVFGAAASLPNVTGAVDELTQVAHNLIDNAIKYGRPGTAIRVEAERVDRLAGTDGPAVVLSVTDQGDGIPAVHLPRLTERFYRVDEGRSRKMGGTGLGLAIVKHIVNRHRGDLRIRSEVGVGTTVTVALPVAPAAKVAGGEAARPQPAAL